MPSKSAADVRKREREVLELRRAGMDFDEIASRCGYANKGSACKAYHRALTRAGSTDASAPEVRDLEVDRLDRLQAGLWAKAARGDLGAVDRVLKISERRARLLGLDLGASPRPAKPAQDETPGEGTVTPPSRLAELRERRARGAADR